jgi:hypothetical protein
MGAALAANCNLWNGGEFYGTPENNSLTLLNKYYAKYPEMQTRWYSTSRALRVPTWNPTEVLGS